MAITANKKYGLEEPTNKSFNQAAVVIIGAGISGICMGVHLIEHGIKNFLILEKGAGLGGTWRDNTYPGCCCDIYSQLYSYSFAQNPNWSRLYPGQEEILNYLTTVAEKYDLIKHIRFSTSVAEAGWNEAHHHWRVAVDVTNPKDAETRAEYVLTTDYLISAVGQLNVPSYPAIPGLATFDGKFMHSARWDWTYDYRGKRIGVIGNGASAVQIIPAIAPDAAQTVVFQRTPNYIFRRGDVAIPRPIRALARLFPPLPWAIRQASMDVRELSHALLMRPDSRKSGVATRVVNALMRRQLARSPQLWDAMTPGYTFGCKRVLLSDDYYPSFERKDVRLVTGGIREITRRGVLVEGGTEHELDALVLATGFQTTDFMHGIKVYGESGTPIIDVWKTGARALYGTAVEKMPNFAMLYGPNTNLGHNSIVLMVEAQVRYLMPLIAAVVHARQQGEALQIVPRPESVEAFNRELQEKLAKTSMADPRAKSWYKNEHGVITNNWHGTAVEYQRLMAVVDWGDYEFGGTKGAVAEAKRRHGGRTGRRTRVGYVAEDSASKLRNFAVYPLCALALYQGLKWNAPEVLEQVVEVCKGIAESVSRDVWGWVAEYLPSEIKI